MRDLDAFAATFRSNVREAGFALDFDGTLAPIVPTPDEAVPLPEAPALLRDLASRYRVVALVSGRRAADLRARVGVPGLRYLGLYGAEELDGGEVAQKAGAAGLRHEAARVAAAAEAFLAASGPPGCLVERKDVAVSLHHRNAPQPEAGALLLGWAEANRPPGFAVRTGRMVVELVPEGSSKAGALEAVVTGEGLRRVVVAGDDVADVEGFRRAHDLLGDRALCIAVASTESPPALTGAADVVVGRPADLLETLRRFL